eukprot:g30553.t1
MSQGLQKAADDNPNTGALLSAMDGALQAALNANSPRHVLLRAALQRLARLDDQLEQQRAALGARGRRRKNRAGPILPDETLAAFVEEEQEALTLLADTRDLLEPEAWQEMYDAWRAQVTSGLEQLAALGITVAGSGSDSSPKKNQSEAMVDPAEAMAEGRRRLRQLEDEYAKRNREGPTSLFSRRARPGTSLKVCDIADLKDDALVEGETAWLPWQAPKELGGQTEAVDSSSAWAEPRRLKMMEEEMEEERMGLGRRHQKAAGEAVESEQNATDEIESWRQMVGVLEQLEASNEHRSGKERFEAVDPSAALAEARRRLKMMEEEMERERMGLGRRHRKAAGEAVESEQDATDEIESWRQVVGVLEQLEVSSKGRTGKEQLEALDPSGALAEARRRLATMEEEMERQRMGLGRRHRKAAGEAVESEQDATDEVESWRQVVGVLEQLEAAKKHPGKEYGTVDPTAALVEARRRLKVMEDDSERQRLGLGRRRPKARDGDQARQEESEVERSLEVKVPSKQLKHRMESVDTSDAVAEARRRLHGMEEESERQRLLLGRRRRKPAEQARREELQKLVEGGTEFESIAREHTEGHSLQQSNIKEVMESDRDAIEEIEFWRQMVGLEELQVAASKMSEQFDQLGSEEEAQAAQAAFEVEEAEESPSRLKRFTVARDVKEDTAEAKQKCQEMQTRLKAMREDEEELLAHMDYRDDLVEVLHSAIRQRVGPQTPIQILAGHSHIRGYRQLDNYSSVYEAGCKLDTVGFVSFKKSADGNGLDFEHANITGNVKVMAGALHMPSLAPAPTVQAALDECIAEGNLGDVQALRQQLHDLREDAFDEAKEEHLEAPCESSSHDMPPREPPKELSRLSVEEELAAVLALSDERIDLVNRMGGDLLSQLEAVFQSEETAELEKSVLSVVERWRSQLPQERSKDQLHSWVVCQPYVDQETVSHLERMSGAAKEAAAAVSDVTDAAARDAFLVTWRERLSSSAKATLSQAELEEQERAIGLD